MMLNEVKTLGEHERAIAQVRSMARVSPTGVRVCPVDGCDHYALVGDSREGGIDTLAQHIWDRHQHVVRLVAESVPE